MASTLCIRKEDGCKDIPRDSILAILPRPYENFVRWDVKDRKCLRLLHFHPEWQTLDGVTSLHKVMEPIKAYRESFPGGPSLPTETMLSNIDLPVGGTRWVANEEAKEGDSVTDTLSLSSDLMTKRLRRALDAIGSHDVSRPYLAFTEEDYLKTPILRLIQGACLLQGALIVPWSVIRLLYKTKAERKSVLESMTVLCGKHARQLRHADGDEGDEEITLRVPSTIFDPAIGTYFTKKEDVEDYTGVWGAISLRETNGGKPNLLGWIWTVGTDARKEYNFSIHVNPSADPTKEPWNARQTVWSSVLSSDPTKTLTADAAHSSLYIEMLCAASGSRTHKSIGKYLMLWAMAQGLPQNFWGVLLEVGYMGFPREGLSECKIIPDLRVASLYHAFFKFQRCFPFNDAILNQWKTQLDECIEKIQGRVIQKDGKRVGKDVRERFLDQVKGIYSQAIDLHTRVFSKDLPSPYIMRFDLAKGERGFRTERRKMIATRRLEEAHKDVDLNVHPEYFRQSEMYRPFPTEIQLRAMLAELIR